MRKHSNTYETNDIVIVPFPFTDSSSTKVRPALVLSPSHLFNEKAEAVILTMITTSGHAPWPFDYPIIDLKSAGLPKASIVRMKLFTLDKRLILRKNGHLSSTDKAKISKNFRALFQSHL